MTTLSVIVPVYRVENYIDECIRSILREIPENTEVILVDDGSPDRCPEICDSYSRQDSRIKVIHKENEGLSSARNAGLEAACGDYIFFLDSDDYLGQDYFKYLLTGKADLVIGNFTAFYSDGTPDYSIGCESCFYNPIDAFLRRFDIYFGTLFNFSWGKLYRRDIIEKYGLRFADSISMTEDLLFNTGYYRHCENVNVESRAVVRYRQIPGSLSRQYNEKTFGWYLISYKCIKTLLIENDLWENVVHPFYQRFAGNVLECVYGSVNSPDRKGLLHEICGNAEVQYAMQCCRLTSLRSRSLVCCIRRRNIVLLIVLIRFYNMLSKIKRKGESIVKKIKTKIVNRSRWLASYPVYWYYRMTWKKPVIHSIEETIQAVLDRRASVSRYGDGELDIMVGRSIGFQQNDPVLAQKMRDILRTEDDRFLVCLNDALVTYNELTAEDIRYWRHNLRVNLKHYARLLKPGKEYFNACISRPYIRYSDKSKSVRDFILLKKIWTDRDVVFVEGDKSRLGVGNDLFDGAKSIRRILCPATGAFAYYDEIIAQVKSLEKSALILLALGPTATAMAYDLYLSGYQTIDIGHVDIEYEWFKMGATSKVAVKNKYTNEATTADATTIGELDDKVYQSQIIARIGLA